MNMKTKILSLSLLFIGSYAFAGGGSSIGRDLCDGASATCRTSDDQTVVCVIEQTSTAYVVTPDNQGGSVLNSFKGITLQPTAPGIMGAPQIFSGDGFDLSVIVDASERPGYLSVPSLSLNNLQMSCL